MTFWFLYINCLLWSSCTRTGGETSDFPCQSQQNTQWREKKIKRNLVQSKLAVPCGWINMWAGQNRKTYERQHLPVLRVNKCLYMTLLLLLGLEALSVPCTCHSGNVWNWRRDSSVTLKCYLVSSIMQTLAKLLKSSSRSMKFTFCIYTCQTLHNVFLTSRQKPQ